MTALLPEDTVPVPLEERDWDWSGNSRKRRLLVRAVLAVKGRTCHLCGLPGATTADHLIPWSHGGRNIMDNLAPAHYSCNSTRGNRTLRQWFAKHPLRTAPTLTPSRVW